ncbi:MAG: OmpH family outer membrane protein [Alphaproteobacteria bacterium]|nr:OmpH family outer membrane protein [Alphaproteobacteria bacterium]
MFVSSANAKDGMRIGIADVVKINKDAKVMVSLNKQKDEKLASIQKEVNAKRKDFEKKEEELKNKQALMDKEAFIKELQSFQADVLKYDKSTEQKVSGVEKGYIDALKTLQKDYLDRIIKQVGKDKGFDLIINSQTAVAIIDGLDITDAIIDALNSEIKEIELKTK